MPAEERRHEQRDGRGQQRERGERRHDQAPVAAGLDGRDVGRPLDDDVPEQPARQEAAPRAPSVGRPRRPRKRQELDHPCAPGELAQVRHVLLPRVEVRGRRSGRTTRTDPTTGSAAPAASLSSLWREERHLAEPLRTSRSSERRVPGRARGQRGRAAAERRASRKASAGPTRNSAFAGLSASATPANVPASTASRYAPASSARTVSAAETRTATTDGKSACCVSPSAWGRNWSTQRSW